MTSQSLVTMKKEYKLNHSIQSSINIDEMMKVLHASINATEADLRKEGIL